MYILKLCSIYVYVSHNISYNIYDYNILMYISYIFLHTCIIKP